MAHLSHRKTLRKRNRARDAETWRNIQFVLTILEHINAPRVTPGMVRIAGPLVTCAGVRSWGDS